MYQVVHVLVMSPAMYQVVLVMSPAMYQVVLVMSLGYQEAGYQETGYQRESNGKRQGKGLVSTELHCIVHLFLILTCI